MKRLIVGLALLALSLAPAAPALAKGVAHATVCGPSDCREVKDHEQQLALIEGGPPTAPPPKASPWYRVEVTIRGDGERSTFTTALLPDAGLVRGEGEYGGYTWMSISKYNMPAVREMTRGIEPFPGSKLRGLDAAAPDKARVSEVVVVDPPNRGSGGGSSVLPWLLGGLAAAAALAATAIFFVRRRRGLPPSPASGPASG
jgi:hypothetical protein